MAHGRCAAEWKQTSSVLALLININRTKKSKAAKPSDLDPYHEDPKQDGDVDFKMKPSELAKLLFGSKKG